MRSAGFLPASHARVLPALGLSLLLHGALLAGWRPALMTPPRLSAFEPIEIALMGVATPQPATNPDTATRAVPNTDTAGRQEPLVQPANGPSLASGPQPDPIVEAANGPSLARGPQLDPIVEARADVASLNNPKPPYPLAARRRGLEGRVLLTAHVGADGACTVVKLKRSSGHGLLDDAALDTVRRWRFMPAQRGARAVDSWVDVPVSFRLDS